MGGRAKKNQKWGKMPIFEYICRDCEEEFEVLIRGGAQVACSHCESESVEKKFSAFALSGNSRSLAAGEPVGACSTCGDPRGAGACSLT